MKIYTLTGDDGSTSLSGGRRVPKDSLRVEAYGSVDELIAWTGLLRDLSNDAGRRDILLYIQDQLMRCATVLASDQGKVKENDFPETGCLAVLEQEIDKMEETLPSLRNFILPGGNVFVSYCHIARCVCRRAERRVISLKSAEHVPVLINKLLNRLSDFLFVLSRKASYETGSQEIRWPIS
jgi:cob(I)alamin adenosyltransferase